MKHKLLYFLLCSITIANAQSFWTNKSTGFAEVNRGVASISIVNDQVVWINAYDGASTTPTNVRQYSRSNDGGYTWVAGTINLGTNQNLLNVSNISAKSYTTAWIAAYSTNNTTVNGGVWKTSNGGATWTMQTTGLFSNSASFCNFVHFFDENNGITQGDPINGNFEIYTTSDGGQNWVAVSSSNLPNILTNEYGYGMFETFENTIWFPTNKGRIYKSTDKGLTWSVSQSPATDFGSATNFARFSFRDNQNGILIKENLQLYQSTDGGSNWNLITSTGKKGARDICYIPNTNKIVSIGTENAISFTSYSIDNGSTWTEVMGGVQVVGLQFLNQNIGFGGGFTASASLGGIYKYSDMVLKNEDFSNDSKYNIYPNPAKNFITINADNLSSVTIYDLQGKSILKSTNKIINIEPIASGIYFVKTIDSNGNSKTEKLIKN